MRRSPLIVGAAVAVGLAMFALFVVFPRGTDVDAVRDEIATAESTLAALEGDVADLRSTQSSGTATADLQAVRRRIPATPDLAGLLVALDAAASESGVTLNEISPGAPSPSSLGAVSVIPLSISVSGSYFALARFLHDLEAQERLTKVSAVAISGGAEGPLSLQITAEVYTTDLSAGPGSDPAAGPEVGA